MKYLFKRDPSRDAFFFLHSHIFYFTLLIFKMTILAFLKVTFELLVSAETRFLKFLKQFPE